MLAAEHFRFTRAVNGGHVVFIGLCHTWEQFTR